MSTTSGGSTTSYTWQCGHCKKEIPDVNYLFLVCPFCGHSPAAKENSRCEKCGECYNSSEEKSCKCTGTETHDDRQPHNREGGDQATKTPSNVSETPLQGDDPLKEKATAVANVS